MKNITKDFESENIKQWYSLKIIFVQFALNAHRWIQNEAYLN